MKNPRLSALHHIPVLALLLCALPAAAEQLDIARLFAAPELAGTGLFAARIAPDGKLVTYLKGAADNKDRLDLWAYDLRTRSHRQLIDARQLLPAEGETLSP